MTMLETARFDPRHLSRMAIKFAKHFPPSLIGQEDFLQIGKLSISRLIQAEHESAQQFIDRGFIAAWRDMVDAARHLHKTRNVQQYGYDLDAVTDPLSFVDVLIDQLDLTTFLRGLTTQELYILKHLAHDETLLDIGIQLHLSESRICQIRLRLKQEYQAACLN